MIKLESVRFVRAGLLCRAVCWLVAVWLAGAGAGIGRGQMEVELIPIDAVWKYEVSGMDLGSEWRSVGYDDSGWMEGPAALGYPVSENIPLTTMQTVVPSLVPSATTTYFRTRFFLSTATEQVTGLVSSNLIDDGAVFYLNGIEAGRVGLPAGVTVEYGTFSNRGGDISGSRVDAVDFPAGHLVAGWNVLAVEVHQASSDSSDLVFASSLYGRIPEQGIVRFIEHPLDQQVQRGASVTFSVNVTGTPPYTFQWYKDGFGLPGETNSVLRLTGVGSDDAGSFHVVAGNPLSMVQSESAELGVLDGAIVVVDYDSIWRYEISGSDLGAEWRQEDYDDTAWAAGPGALGDESAVLPEPIRTEYGRSQGVVSEYFRTRFVFDEFPGDFELQVAAEFDDGAVVYLNGVELFRLGMPSGPVAFNTLAGRTVDNAAIETLTIPAGALRQGTNILAVELHQIASTSSDSVMGLRILAELPAPRQILLTRQPAGLVVEELKPVVFSVEYEGNRERIQWFKDGVAIAGATAASYPIPAVSLADSGAYHVVVSNVVSVATSGTAILTVLPDLTSPTLVGADGTVEAGRIVLSFSEPVSEPAATQLENYVLTNRFGGVLAIHEAVLTNGTNVVLTTEPRADDDYLLFVSNVSDVSSEANLIRPASLVSVSSLAGLVGWESEWRFYDPFPGLDPLNLGTDWSQFAYPPVADWGSGRAAFGLGGGAGPMLVPIHTPLSGGAITAYFRQTFAYDGSPLGARLRLRHVAEDGAVFYLNGNELTRYNLPAGGIDHLTPSLSSTELDSVTEVIDLPTELLRQGENVLAVELHARSLNDPGRLFACELEAEIESKGTGPILVTDFPSTLTVVEGEEMDLRFRAAGPTEFQWYRDELLIAGATNRSYQIPRVLFSDDGSFFHVVAANETSSVVTDMARLTVLPDTVGPGLVSAFGKGEWVTVTFDEAVEIASALSLQNYSFIDAEPVQVVAVEMLGPTSVRVQTQPSVRVGAVLKVSGIRDTSVAANVIPSGPGMNVGFDGILLQFDSPWRYDDSGADLGVAWRELGFDDSDWNSGSGLLGETTGSPPVQTLVLAPGSGGPITTYYRARFASPHRSLSVVDLSYFADDGLVVYLNGTEIHRSRVSPGQTFYSLATTSVSGFSVEGPFEIPIPEGLVAADNVLAVELHQVSAASSDTLFGAALSFEAVPSIAPLDPRPAPTLLIERNFAGSVILSWEGEGFLLEQAASLGGPWVAFPASTTSPATRPTFGSTRYFRLRTE